MEIGVIFLITYMKVLRLTDCMEAVIWQIRDIWAIVKQVNFSCWRGRGNLKGFQKLLGQISYNSHNS